MYPTVWLPLQSHLHIGNGGFCHVVFDISFWPWFCYRLSKCYPSPRWRSFKGIWLPTLRSVSGMTLTLSPAVAPASASWSEFYCCFYCEFKSEFMIYLCFSNLISQYHLEVLWQFLTPFSGPPWDLLHTVPIYSSLGHCSSSCSTPSVVWLGIHTYAFNLSEWNGYLRSSSFSDHSITGKTW